MNRKPGIDGWDVALHAVVTAAIGVFALSYFSGYFPDEQVISGIVGGSAALLGLRLHQARRIGGQNPGSSDVLEEVRERLASLEARSPVTGETDLVAQRLLELEERVDFTERLLTQGGPVAPETASLTPDSAA